MPNRDGTGPEGKGPKTGRAMGPCNTKEKTKESPQRGAGLGRGQGRGQNRRVQN